MDSMINNNIDSLISEIIPKLDQFNDGLLIELLERKRKSYLWNEDNEYKIRHSITEREKSRALFGLRVTLNSIRMHYVDWYLKIEKILENNSCDKCKHAIIDKYNELNYNPESKICSRCTSKCYKLMDLRHEYSEDFKKYVEKRVFTDELIELKAIINKLKTKLKNYDAS